MSKSGTLIILDSINHDLPMQVNINIIINVDAKNQCECWIEFGRKPKLINFIKLKQHKNAGWLAAQMNSTDDGSAILKRPAESRDRNNLGSIISTVPNCHVTTSINMYTDA